MHSEAASKKSSNTLCFYMDDTVAGNIVRLLSASGLRTKLGEAISAEKETTLFVKIGQRYIDLK